jgi:Aspartyl/Asparaginyl beta-hydroxylase
MDDSLRTRSRAVLDRFADGFAIDRPDLRRIYSALEGTNTGAPLQRPDVLCPGLSAHPWRERVDHSWVSDIEDSYSDIEEEFAKIYPALEEHPESEDLAGHGRWNTYHFYNIGQADETHLSECRRTAAVLHRIPGADSAGMCYFSVMDTDTWVKPHCGFVNTRIRCHLGIRVPGDCRMRVGAETRTWEEGKCLVFDDSFEHEVWNGAEGRRAVLLLDVWHPELTALERLALSRLMAFWRSHAA